MGASREDLLRPTLSEHAPAAAPYSIQTTFFTGFFGGPFGALAIIGWNAARLRRLARDLPILAALFALIVGAGWALHTTAAGGDLQAAIADKFGSGSLRFVYRLMGLLVVGMGYLLHRREQRNADLVGMERPNGWIGGIACIVIGSAAMIGYGLLLSRI